MGANITCQHCKEIVYKLRRDAKYCSDLCRKRASVIRLKNLPKNNKPIIIYEDEMNLPECTETDLWILIARLCKISYECGCGDLLSELNFRRKVDIEFFGFKKRFGISFEEAQEKFPTIRPDKQIEGHFQHIFDYAHLDYSSR